MEKEIGLRTLSPQRNDSPLEFHQDHGAFAEDRRQAAGQKS